jgi:hypothetical protein
MHLVKLDDIFSLDDGAIVGNDFIRYNGSFKFLLINLCANVPAVF